MVEVWLIVGIMIGHDSYRQIRPETQYPTAESCLKAIDGKRESIASLGYFSGMTCKMERMSSTDFLLLSRIPTTF
jgi:hypothetical protein